MFNMSPSTIQIIGAVLFALALLHTFSAKYFLILAHRYPRHAGLYHLLGEVEVVFGFWAFILICLMAFSGGTQQAIDYAESRKFTEPLFVFVVMVIAASRPVLNVVGRSVHLLARILARIFRIPSNLIQVWLGFGVIPLIGSLITEPAAMTLAALTLAPLVFRPEVSEHLKYGALGVLFVNISIGGTLTSYAAPPVLMVAHTWGWDSSFLFFNLGWKAIIATVINATVISYLLRKQLIEQTVETRPAVPLLVSFIHLFFLGLVVALAHHPVLFIGLFLFFLGYTQAYDKHQDPLILKEGLLVSFFLAGLVVIGGMQQWWLQPIISSLKPGALFLGATALTAITDNAALTYLGSLITGLSDQAKIMLVAGSVAGGGLTVIANAPNPAGAALLKRGFQDESIGALELLMGAALPTVVASCLLIIDLI